MQFTLARLAIAITCLAAAMGFVTFCLRPSEGHRYDIFPRLAAIWTLAPLLGVDIGLAMGLLCGRPRKGIEAGVLVAIVAIILTSPVLVFATSTCTRHVESGIPHSSHPLHSHPRRLPHDLVGIEPAGQQVREIHHGRADAKTDGFERVFAGP